MELNMDRRGFLKGAAAAGLTATAVAGVGATQAHADEAGSPADISWDLEADVVVVGFGGAGGSASLGAAEAGASVLLLEKAPSDQAGGNTGVCGGGMVVYAEGAEAGEKAYMDEQLPDTASDEEVNAFIEENIALPAWLEDHGLAAAAMAPADDTGKSTLMAAGAGAGLFDSLHELVEENDNITINYETRATKLIFDPDTKEVYGVYATTADGNEIACKAHCGVVMACGGFENDHELLTTYGTPMIPTFPCGTPYNTGDGIRMLSELGVKPRGFSSIEWGCHCCKPGSEEVGFALAFGFMSHVPWDGSVMVNDKGKRFVNEADGATPGASTLRPLHAKNQLPELAFDMTTYKYTNLPMYFITSSTHVADGPLFNAAAEDASNHWAHIRGGYTWSEDNQAEIEKGWITEADTLEELAEKLGIDPEGLVQTVDAFNAACESGEDEFGRVDGMTPITEPPFYGCELGLGIINTQGGAVRDGSHRVLDNNDEPIPRLYSAGELGSIYCWLYHGAGNFPESLGGRYAGAYAAALEPWD